MGAGGHGWTDATGQPHIELAAASVCLAPVCARPGAPEVMAQLGHTDARLTLRVYARAMSQDHGERERLQTLVNGHSFGHQWALEPSGTGKAGLSARAG